MEDGNKREKDYLALEKSGQKRNRSRTRLLAYYYFPTHAKTSWTPSATLISYHLHLACRLFSAESRDALCTALCSVGRLHPVVTCYTAYVAAGLDRRPLGSAHALLRSITSKCSYLHLDTSIRHQGRRGSPSIMGYPSPVCARQC